MKIVKYAKYVGTMIGPEGYLHRWTAQRKSSSKELGKSMGPPKSLVERLTDFKIYALSVLGYWGSISAPDGTDPKRGGPCAAMHGPCNAIPTDPLRAGSVCGGVDPFGDPYPWPCCPNSERLPMSNTLAGGLAKILVCSPRIRRCPHFSPSHTRKERKVFGDI